MVITKYDMAIKINFNQPFGSMHYDWRLLEVVEKVNGIVQLFCTNNVVCWIIWYSRNAYVQIRFDLQFVPE